MNVDTTRLRLGDLIAGVSGLVLFISLFLTWYTWKSNTPELGGARSFSESGWAVLTLLDKLLLLAAIAAIALAVLRATRALPDLPFNVALVTLVLGVLATLFTLYRLARIPGGLFAEAAEIEVQRSVGIFVALLASLGVTVGAWLAWNEEGRSSEGPNRRRRTQPVAQSGE